MAETITSVGAPSFAHVAKDGYHGPQRRGSFIRESVADLYSRRLLSSEPVPPTLAKGAQGWGTHII